MKIIIYIVSITFIFSAPNAHAMEGKWLFQKNHSDNFDRALNIQGSSFISLITTSEGAAYESGWWTETGTQNEKTSVIVRYGDDQPETIFYKLDSADKGTLWLADEEVPWGTMSRMNCDLSMQYRNKSDLAPNGCAWLHIRGWGYSALEGECIYNEEWINIPDDNNSPMECLIEAPANFVL